MSSSIPSATTHTLSTSVELRSLHTSNELENQNSNFYQKYFTSSEQIWRESGFYNLVANRFSNAPGKRSRLADYVTKNRSNSEDFFDQDYGTKLHKAIIEKNVSHVEKWIEKYPDLINTLDMSGNSPLHVALDLNYQEVCKELVREQSQVDDDSLRSESEEEGYSQEDLDIIKLLIANSADVNQYNSDGMTPLLLTLETPQKHQRNLLLKWLLNAQADPIAKGPEGWSPIHLLIHENSQSALKIILEYDFRIKWASTIIQSIMTSDELTLNDWPLVRRLIDEKKLDGHQLAQMIARINLWQCPRLCRIFDKLVQLNLFQKEELEEHLVHDSSVLSHNLKRAILNIPLKKIPFHERVLNKAKYVDLVMNEKTLAIYRKVRDSIATE